MNGPAREPMRLAEEYSGRGELSSAERVHGSVQYEIRRFQGYSRSGLPVPGMHRIEGTLKPEAAVDTAALVGRELTLLLEDGRTLKLALADESGRVLAVGHGPSRCSCC